jgi:hypothetical protein
MTPAPSHKSWLLCSLDGLPGLLEIQRNDALMLAATDDDALRRARCEARRGRRHPMEAVALHQRAKALCRAYRLRTIRNNGG